MQAGIPFYEIPARLLVFKEALPRGGNLVFLVLLVSLESLVLLVFLESLVSLEFLVLLVFPVPLYFLENQAPLTRPVRRRPRHRRRYRG